jgi:AraC-like DNA-binding protein
MVAATDRLWSAASLTEIAFEMGFSDLAHMTRAFRSSCGMAPSQLRRLALMDMAGGA